MKTSRRVFLKSGGLALVSVGLAPGWGPQFLRDAVFAAEPKKRRKTIICIFQRGAVDGLSMIVPHGDSWYYRHRNLNGIALPRTGAGAVLDLDGTFGLHPALAGLLPIWKAGHLAAIQACGSPSASRSHFDAQDYMECGSPDRVLPTGWLARALENCPEDTARREAENKVQSAVFRGVALTNQTPLSLRGSGALAFSDLRSFAVGANSVGVGAKKKQTANAANNGANDGGAAAGFEAMYEGAVGDVLHGTGEESFEAIRMLKSLTAKTYVPAAGAKYPGGRFGLALQQIAQLVKADVGVEVAFAESGGWDTHVGQGATQGRLARNLSEFGQGLAALYADLGDRMDDVVILTMSEFGRTARQNGTGGTDHGHATCFFALGASVNGGKVLGKWPGLAPEQLYEQRDLAVTTDFRDVFAEVAQKHLGVTDLEAVFPGFTAQAKNFRNVLRA